MALRYILFHIEIARLLLPDVGPASGAWQAD